MVEIDMFLPAKTTAREMVALDLYNTRFLLS